MGKGGKGRGGVGKGRGQSERTKRAVGRQAGRQAAAHRQAGRPQVGGWPVTATTGQSQPQRAGRADAVRSQGCLSTHGISPSHKREHTNPDKHTSAHTPECLSRTRRPGPCTSGTRNVSRSASPRRRCRAACACVCVCAGCVCVRKGNENPPHDGAGVCVCVCARARVCPCMWVCGV